MKRLLLLFVAGAALLFAILLVRAWQFTKPPAPAVAPATVSLDADAAAARFARALTFKTVSYQRPETIDSAEFRRLHAYLQETYPRVHAKLRRETISDLSLLYTWPGRDPEAAPVVLMGHLDVVPVAPETRDRWRHPPFGGVIADGYVWGRGAMDDKSSVLAILEAVERLLAQEFQPQATVYLAFGHDEELGGPNGAKRIAARLAERGVRDYALVLDEGGVIAEGLIPGLAAPTALIGIAEKGSVSLELKVEGDGGHSSMPPAETNIGILSRAIVRLEEHPFPSRLEGAAIKMFETIGPELPLSRRLLLANLWLFKPLLARQLARNPRTAAMIRTTTAPTLFNAGVKVNVLPSVARAVVNFRIIPGETPESVTARVREILADDRVQVNVLGGRAPSPVSDPDSPAFQLLSTTLRQVVPEENLLVTPYLVMGGTDARYYAGRSSNVFRFLPIRLEPGDRTRFHGIDERLSVESFATSVKFFYQLLRNLNGKNRAS